VTIQTAVVGWSEMAALLRKGPAVSFVLAFVAATVAASVALVSVVTLIEGGGAPGWSHWLCSPAALRSAVHAVRGSGLGATLLTALEVHWPHFLPILAGLGTLVYLWRANALYYTK
jgi:hypothetical protein